jgi:Protein of unknown function (DUF3592)
MSGPMTRSMKIVAAIVLLSSLVAVIVSFAAAGLLIGVFVLLAEAATLSLIYRVIFAPQIRRNILLQKGVAAEARILEVQDTGLTVNERYPMIKLRLQVMPGEGEPYEAKIRMLINRMEIPTFQAGKMVAVKYDPANPQNVAIVGEADPVAESPDDPEKLRQAGAFLARIDQENEELLASGKPAKAFILKSWPLGIDVNGNNPAMSFLLEVTPEGQDAFQAEATAIISEASLPKFQPGNSIFVKYDPAKLNRVGIDHS